MQRQTRPAVLALSLILLAACEQPLSSQMKLQALVAHERKMEIILQDLQAECDSSVESTLRARVDSLEAALKTEARQRATPPFRPKAVQSTPPPSPAASTHRAKGAHLPDAANRAHQKPRHHHQHTQP